MVYMTFRENLNQHELVRGFKVEWLMLAWSDMTFS